ncbi:MAG: hypothetical protein KC496_13685, partial [Anaerolineae bacterium]|nr:hypothetical protein [Anaerolineae bacterium]
MAAINQEAIDAERQRLYESASLRDDLDDTHATTLLQWGEEQVKRLAEEYPEDFEQKARFLRQLIKNINRFVGQRQYNDEAGQREYMEKVSKYLEPLGFGDLSTEEILAQLPTEKTDHASNLQAIFQTLGTEEQDTTPEPDEPSDPANPL